MTGSIHNLSPDTQAKEATRSILTDHFACIRSQLAAAFSAHMQARRELRNSARKLVFALEYFRPFVNYEQLVDARESLDVINQTLGEICDEETFIKSLIKVQPEAPLEFLDGIRGLVEERKSLLNSLLKAFAAHGESKLRLLEATFSNRLADALKPGFPRSVTLSEVARSAISDCLDEMVAASLALYRPSKTRTSHRLRISVRKLRYALEIFSPYFTADLRALSAELTPLHVQLGKLRDCDLKLNALGDWLTEKQIKMTIGTSSQWHAAIWLLTYFYERRPRHYRKALAAGQELLADGFATRVACAVSGGQLPGGSTDNFTLPPASFLLCTNEGLRSRESNE
jgi:CHAD domain-containing protein